MPSSSSKRISSHLIPTEKSYLLGKDTSNTKSFAAWNRLYDIITMFITLMDLITDILLLSQFYCSSDGMTFFWFSLSFILLTHICYVVLALVSFGLSLSTMSQIIWFLCLIPISPLLPYIIYCASWPDSFITIHIIDKFGLERLDWNNHGNNNNLYSSTNRNNSWKKFVSEKLVTNIAFIMQSICESFPLSIIQIIAIVSFQQYRNIILLTSISFSLLSIVWKSILMASGASISSSIYKWLSFVTDFYSILFVMISWAFLSVDINKNENYDFFGLLNIAGISSLGYIYIYKVLFLVSPLVIFVVILLIFELSIDSIHDFLCWKSRPFIVLIVCYVPFVIIVVVTLVILGLLLSIIAAEFAVFSWTAWFVEIFFNERYKWLDKPVFWDIIVNNFLLINCKDNKDLVKRLCIVNYILSQTTESEWVKRMFVDFNSFMSINEYKVFHDPQYQMSLNKLRAQFRDTNSRSAPTMFGSIFRNYIEHIPNLPCFNFQEFFLNIIYFLILFIGIPFYILSRIITIIYPFWCMIYMLFFNGNNNSNGQSWYFSLNGIQTHFNQIPIFFVITTFIYCMLILILIISGRKLYRLMNILWHIMPGRQKLVKSLIVDKTNMDYMRQLNSMYDFHINRPAIYDILGKKFSTDVGKIILEYLPRKYYEECRLYINNKVRPCNRRRKRRISRKATIITYDSMTPSSSPHLAIDCVDPLPPMSARYWSSFSQDYNEYTHHYQSNYNSILNRTEDDEKEQEAIFVGINMTVPQFAIPIDCDDPLSLLSKQHHQSFS